MLHNKFKHNIVFIGRKIFPTQAKGNTKENKCLSILKHKFNKLSAKTKEFTHSAGEKV